MTGARARRWRAGAGVAGAALAGTLWLPAGEAPADAADLPPAAVYVEDAPAAAELLLRADAVAAEGRPGDAAALLDRVLEEHGGGLVPAPADADGARRWVEAWTLVAEKLAADPALAGAWRERAEPEAARARAEALGRVGRSARADALAAVARRWAPAGAGREAALDAAALALEAGDAEGALGRLDRLGGGGGGGRAATLRDAAERLTAASPAGSSAGTDLPGGEPAGPVFEEAAWTHWFGVADEGVGGAGRRGGFAATPGPVPAVVGDRVYLNTGDELLRLDRDAGRPVWSAAAVGPGGAGAAVDPFGSGAPLPPAGGRGVLVRGGRAFAVLGREAEPRFRRFGFGGGGEADGVGTRVVCVDAESGRPLWSVEPAALDPSLERADFVGTPLGSPGDAAGTPVVLVLRRGGRAGFTDFQAVGLDPEDGSLRWLRPLSSVSTDQRFGAGPAGGVDAAAAGGRVYLGEGVGLAASLAAADGSVDWLRAPDAGADGGAAGRVDPRRARRAGPGEDAPIPTGAGVLLPGDGPSGVTLLDPRSGRSLPLPGELGRLGPEALRWLAPVPAAGRPVGLLAVRGSTAFGLDPGTLSPRWATPVGDDTRPRPGVEPAGPEAVAVVGGEALRLRWADGALLERRVWPTGAAFAPAGAGGRAGGGWLVGQGGSLSLFDQPGAALRRLEARVRRSPGDPLPGLALAFRGAETGDAGALLAGVEAALGATDGPPAGPDAGADRVDLPEAPDPVNPSGAEVAAELLERVGSAAGLPAAARRAALRRVAASGRADPVSLAFVGASLATEEGDAPAAVAALRGVLEDPELADRLFRLGGLTRRAGLEARERLADALAAAGERADPYGPARAAAAAELEGAEPGGDPAELEALARRYPFAASASAALLRAADAQEGPAAGARARGLRRWAYRAALDARDPGRDPAAPAAAAAAASAAAAAEARSGRVAAARAWARRLAEDLPGQALRPPADAGVATATATDPLAWIDALAASSAGGAATVREEAPAVGPLRLAGPRLPGRLAAAAPAPPDDASAGPASLGGAFGEVDPGAAPPGRAGSARVVMAGADPRAHWRVLAPAGAAFAGFRFPAPPPDSVVLLDDGGLLVLFSPTARRLYRVRPPAGDAGEGSGVGTTEVWDPNPPLAAVPGAAPGGDTPGAGAGAGEVGGVVRRLDFERRRDAAQRAAMERLREDRRRLGGGVDVEGLAVEPGPEVPEDAGDPGDPGDPGAGVRVLLRPGFDAGGAWVADAAEGAARLFAAASPDAVVVADDLGRVVSLDPATGRVQWARRAPVDGVTGLLLSAEQLVVRGVDAAGTESAVFRLARLDPLTGATRTPEVTEAAQEPRGVGFGGGQMVVVFDRFVAVYGLPDGGLRWRSPAPDDEAAGFSGRVLVGGGVVAAAPAAGGASGGGTTCVFDASTGTLRARLLAEATAAGGAAGSSGSLVLADDRLHTGSGSAFSLEGERLAGAAGASGAGGAVVLTRDAALFTASVRGHPGPGSAVLRLDRATGRRLEAVPLPPMPGGLDPGPARLRVVDGLVLAGDAGGVHVLSDTLPPPPPPPPGAEEAE